MQYVLRGHTGPVSNFDFSPDQKTLLTASADNTARIWNLENGKQDITLEEHSDKISDVLFSCDGKFIATASLDNTARIWDRMTGRCTLVLKHPAWVGPLSFSADGARLLTTCFDGTAKIWNLVSGMQEGALIAVDGRFKRAIFCTDSLYAVTADSEGKTMVWDTRTLAEVNAKVKALPRHASILSPDDKTAIYTDESGITASIWEVETKKQLFTLHGPDKRINLVAFSPDGMLIVATSDDYTAHVWSKRRPEKWTGIMVLPITWLILILALGLCSSLIIDQRKRLEFRQNGEQKANRASGTA